MSSKMLFVPFETQTRPTEVARECIFSQSETLNFQNFQGNISLGPRGVLPVKEQGTGVLMSDIRV